MSPSIEMTRRILQMQWLTLSLYHPLTTPQHPLTTLPFNTPFHATLARNDPSHPSNAMAHSESLPPAHHHRPTQPQPPPQPQPRGERATQQS